MSKRPGILGCLDVSLKVLGHINVSETTQRTLTYDVTLSKGVVCHNPFFQSVECQIERLAMARLSKSLCQKHE